MEKTSSLKVAYLIIVTFTATSKNTTALPQANLEVVGSTLTITAGSFAARHLRNTYLNLCMIAMLVFP